jgi:hypothetical protein
MQKNKATGKLMTMKEKVDYGIRWKNKTRR